MKRKVSVILALALVLCMICSMFAFVACDEECTEHVDADGDGICDNCGESVIMSYYPDYAMNRIIDNLSAQYSELAGSYVFGVSFEAAIDAKKGAAQATQYVLRGKASIDLRANEAVHARNDHRRHYRIRGLSQYAR